MKIKNFKKFDGLVITKSNTRGSLILAKNLMEWREEKSKSQIEPTRGTIQTIHRYRKTLVN